MSIQKIIQKKIQELPKRLRTAVEEFPWETQLLKITREQDLQIDDASTLHREILLVICGIENGENLAKNIEDHLGLATESSRTLVEKINRHILEPLQKSAFRPEQGSKSKDSAYRETIRPSDLAPNINPEIPKPRHSHIQDLDRKNFEHPYFPKEDSIKIKPTQKSTGFIHFLKN
jgi:hypothetical protein